MRKKAADTPVSVLSHGRAVLADEARAMTRAARRLGDTFVEAVHMIRAARGKVIVSGIGKSGLVAQRIASILSSTGTPAYFLHPTEGLHGDIGIVSDDDVVILISHSGKNDELLNLIPHIKRARVRIILISRDRQNTLSRFADLTLETGVTREACPFNLVPSTSSAVTAGLGDALAIALLRAKGLRQEDYKRVHPGGSIGKRLLYRVSDLMHTGTELPIVSRNASLREAVRIMTEKGLGMTCVTDTQGRLCGIVTDGDLRRLLQADRADLSAPVTSLKLACPKTVRPDLLAIEALAIMEKHAITSLIAVHSLKDLKPAGVIHMHDILKAGVV
ncbi:MAG: KpsF/GutQ family sugar-phosphate isomerase [Fibrobacterota bacterium]